MGPMGFPRLDLDQPRWPTLGLAAQIRLLPGYPAETGAEIRVSAHVIDPFSVSLEILEPRERKLDVSPRRRHCPISNQMAMCRLCGWLSRPGDAPALGVDRLALEQRARTVGSAGLARIEAAVRTGRGLVCALGGLGRISAIVQRLCGRICFAHHRQR
jgi:hypothetical protein